MTNPKNQAPVKSPSPERPAGQRDPVPADRPDVDKNNDGQRDSNA